VSGTRAGVASWVNLATPESRLLVIAAGCVTLAIVTPSALDRLPQLCLWERLLGCCPAHGTTHALWALLHGDLARAVACNVNVLLVAPLLLDLAARDVCQLLHRQANSRA